jgi:carbon storage regulator CsrA
MLVLSRKPGEKLVIGEGITLTVLSVIGNRVRLGIDAPEDVRVLRSELAEWQRQWESGQEEERADPTNEPELVPLSSGRATANCLSPRHSTVHCGGRLSKRRCLFSR